MWGKMKAWADAFHKKAISLGILSLPRPLSWRGETGSGDRDERHRTALADKRFESQSYVFFLVSFASERSRWRLKLKSSSAKLSQCISHPRSCACKEGTFLHVYICHCRKLLQHTNWIGLRQSERLATHKLALLLPVLTFVLECVLIFTVVKEIYPSEGPIQVRLYHWVFV